MAPAGIDLILAGGDTLDRKGELDDDMSGVGVYELTDGEGRRPRDVLGQGAQAGLLGLVQVDGTSLDGPYLPMCLFLAPLAQLPIEVSQVGEGAAG